MEKNSKLIERVNAIVDGNFLPSPESADKEKKVGKPTLYHEYVPAQVEMLAKEGLNNKQIAKSLGIGEKTFYEWLEKYPQLSHSLKKYRGLADIEVENALYRNAVGYNYKEQAVTNRGEVVTVQKYHSPNTTAQIFYLKNRMPDRYKDKVEHELTLAEDIGQMAFMIKRREE